MCKPSFSHSCVALCPQSAARNSASCASATHLHARRRNAKRSGSQDHGVVVATDRVAGLAR
ncbi:MAG: hypothetical protein IPJ52_02040 [Rhodocyclaceae bacterium]|nr:hypothetical protein [Rhodocyclaceae bacterium]